MAAAAAASAATRASTLAPKALAKAKSPSSSSRQSPPPPPPPPAPALPNPYEAPTLNSSVALQEQLRALAQKLDDDAVSVDSFSTTSSARLSAAGVVNVPADVLRYQQDKLTRVLGESTPALPLACLCPLSPLLSRSCTHSPHPPHPTHPPQTPTS